MNRNSQADTLIRRLPKKWAVGLIALLIAYALFQPFAQKKWGWNLPSLATLSGQTGEDSKDVSAADKADKDSSVADSASHSKPSPNTSDTLQDQQASSSATALEYGILKSIGNEEYLSPAGLRYTRGSAEGHRLKHIAKHLSDQPSRDGPHGVFKGDMSQVLRWIDEAYERSERGGNGVKQSQQGDRLRLDATFDQPIGFVGGSVGKRKGNPSTKVLRLILEQDRVITAYPY